MFIAVSCGDEEATPANSYNAIIANSPNVRRMGDTSTASNGTVITMGDIQAVSEGNTDLRQAAARLEIPRLKGGDRNLFIVHTLNDKSLNYCVEWSYDQKAQYWSALRWDRTNSGGSAGYSGNFDEDPLIPSQYRTTLSDHYNNGYDRGHIVASADRQQSKEANQQTFYLSNMQPQLNGFNSNNGNSNWYTLENRLRKIYNTNGFRDTLYVVKGGTISEGKYTMKKGLPVPSYFFMAVLCKKNSVIKNNGYFAIGYWMKHESNSDTSTRNYAVSINRLEELTGIDFFCNLPDDIEEKIESSLSLSEWKY